MELVKKLSTTNKDRNAKIQEITAQLEAKDADIISTGQKMSQWKEKVKLMSDRDQEAILALQVELEANKASVVAKDGELTAMTLKMSQWKEADQADAAGATLSLEKELSACQAKNDGLQKGTSERMECYEKVLLRRTERASVIGRVLLLCWNLL